MKQINIDGIKYELDVLKAIDEGCLTKLYPPVKVGDHFQKQDSKALYILAYANPGSSTSDDNEMQLIDINTGFRWFPVVRVENPQQITDKEWKKVTAAHTFIKVTLNIEVQPFKN